jgi:2-hydroxy-3-oxopropionate reductase
MATIGCIGLGIMGRPAALNLIKASHALKVYARRPETLEPLLARGAVQCESPAKAARESDFVVVNVSDTPDVREVLLGRNGVAEGATAGTVVIDMSTISPAATREMSEALAGKGIGMLDAPVSGGEKGAIEGTLSFMVGGKKECFDRAFPILEAMGRNIIHVGSSGAGQVVKACNQVVIGATIEGVAEAVRLARRNDVDPALMRTALLGGFAGSRVMEIHCQRMLDDDYTPGFKAKLHLKDMRIALETAEACGAPLPSADLFAARLDKSLERGEGELDSSVIFRILDGGEE